MLRMAETPEEVLEEARALRAAVTAAVPKKSDRNLLVATWNLRGFGDLTEKWNAKDSPKRDCAR